MKTLLEHIRIFFFGKKEEEIETVFTIDLTKLLFFVLGLGALIFAFTYGR